MATTPTEVIISRVLMVITWTTPQPSIHLSKPIWISKSPQIPSLMHWFAGIKSVEFRWMASRWFKTPTKLPYRLISWIVTRHRPLNPNNLFTSKKWRHPRWTTLYHPGLCRTTILLWRLNQPHFTPKRYQQTRDRWLIISIHKTNLLLLLSILQL